MGFALFAKAMLCRSTQFVLIPLLVMALPTASVVSAEVAGSEGSAGFSFNETAQVMTGGFDACWDAIEPTSFTDTAGLSDETQRAIDCIFHYGITKGTSATKFSPEDPVIRLHMALFLSRTIKVLGLEIPQEVANTFGDLDSASAESRLAVSQLKELGITTGYSPQVFGPNNNVERVHMAHFLARMLRLTDISLPSEMSSSLNDIQTLNNNAKADISLMIALGIMAPVTHEQFEPRSVVTRQDMALFLARILDLSDLEPVRLELELSSSSSMVGGVAIATVRALKPDNTPYRGLLIDVFADLGWRRGTGCNLDIDARLAGGDAGTSTDCIIDNGDPKTDANGEVSVGFTHTADSATHWIFAWTGTLGQEFHQSKVLGEVKEKFEWKPTPIEVTTIDPLYVLYGTSVSVSARLVGPNSQGQRMVLVGSYKGVVRITRSALTEEDGTVKFDLPGVDEPIKDQYEPLGIDETIFVYWDRNGNTNHDGPAELSARTTIYWR